MFQDEHGDYPAGTYVRNPPTTRHKPGSEQGCTIFVKLWQFNPDDRTQVAIDMSQREQAAIPELPGLSAALLFEDDRELVRLERWSPGVDVSRDMPGGAELFILTGSCTELGDEMREQSWLRIPVGGRLNAVAGAQGARVWIKTGGLRFVDFAGVE